MKECLHCKKEFKPQRPTRKFCSDSCRVMYHRKHGKQNEIKPFQMQVLYNQLLEAVNKIGQINNLPLAAAYEMQPIKTEPIKKSGWDEPAQTNLLTFQELLNGMADVQFSDDKESYAKKIRKATHLSEKQINLLLTNLWSKQ